MWTSAIKKPTFKVFKHKKGSHVTKDHLYMRSEGTFASKFKISRILKALFDPVHRGEWEKKNLESYTVHETDHPNVNLPYWRYRPVLAGNAKEYKDKFCIFIHKATVYVYTNTNATALHDAQSESIGARTCPDRKCDNCQTIIGLYKFYHDQAGKVKLECLMQSDIQRGWTPKALIDSMGPKSITDWFTSLSKYIAKEHDGLLA